MNQNPTPRWSPMVSGPEDEFANFLDFGDLNFSGFDGIQQRETELEQQNGGMAMDTSVDLGAGQAFGLEHGHMPQQQQQMGSHSHAIGLNGYHTSAESFPELDLQSEMFKQQQGRMHIQNQTYRSQNVVPPTPNSMEMQAAHTNYYQNHIDQQQLHLYEQYRRQKEQMIFTPLVSPAVTPLDTQYQYPDYAAPPDGTFSPLTSPALRAQHNAAHQSVYKSVRGSDTSDTTSPIDPSLEYTTQTSTSTPVAVRKSKRKTSSASAKCPPSRAVKQSPAMKPQRKKNPSSTHIPPKEISGIIEEARKSKHDTHGSQSKLPVPYGQDSSGADSVSPEPLSEVLMPPPATPKSGSASKSPYLEAKQKGPNNGEIVSIANEKPATPASLMKIRKEASKARGSHQRSSSLKEQTAAAEADMEQIIEDIVLPEAATPSTTKPALRPINTTDAIVESLTPTISALQTPKYGPASAPITANTSGFPSPQLAEVASPAGSTALRYGDSKQSKGRDPKKRNSQSSVHVSPAVRPKISPSIKPLLPEGTVISADTSALLLASKSNYQNILEGTHLPGVSYPENLSTNLTSKRTSHKIAEQGRRNRINTALQEIASLLPKNTTPEMNGVNGNGTSVGSLMMNGTAAQQSNSKASTVESAIEYIKTLQKELEDTKGRVEVLEKEKINTKREDMEETTA